MSTIYDSFDFGFDPTVPDDLKPKDVAPTALPAQASVDSQYLPPVGKQTMPNCFVWASTYGLATVWAAQAGEYSPTSPSQQAAPDYTYIQVEEATGIVSGACVGGKMASVFSFLSSNGGTAALSAAQNQTTCSDNWNAYGPGTTPIAADASFAVPGVGVTSISNGTQGLNNMRTIIASGVPLAYGTRLYTDFPPYDGTPSPYVGNGVILKNKTTGKDAGHCMMIIGYDDAYNGGDGAVLIQNSFGASWGSSGFVWMAYATFQALAQGSGAYVTSSS